MSLLLVDALAVGSCLVVLLYAWYKRDRSSHLPPGPPGLPLIGNLLQFPRKGVAHALRDLSEEYGDIMTLRLPRLTMLVLNSRQAISDLLVERSAVYSNRSKLVMSRELAGFEGSLSLSDYTLRLRTCRKLLHRGLGAHAARSLAPFLDRQAAFFLDNLRQRPSAFVDVARRNAAAVSMNIAYGYADLDEELFGLACMMARVFAEVTSPGKWLVDVFPILRHLPAWFPLAYFKRYAARVRPVIAECINRPFDETKRQMDLGTAGTSFCAMLLDEAHGNPEMEYCTKYSSTSILIGQMDTTTAAMSWFFLAMALHPEVQAKAQAEIDKVIGSDRLPRVEDQEDLPYVKAIMQEVFRWHPIVNLIPHAASRDDIYRGYIVPAGAVALANAWAIFHDETVYHDADKFIPERFSEEGAPDSMDIAFGFGRRICPGKLVAQAHLFVSIAATLSTFNIAKARGPDGSIIEPVVEDSPGAINAPQPFEISLKPRSQAADDLIRRSVELSKMLPDKLEVFSTGS